VKVVGASVRGTVHERDGIPNQDAIAWSSPGGDASQLVAALSDGHGSRTAFRSHRGAALAVRAGIRCGLALVQRLGPGGLAGFDERLRRALVVEIVEEWRTSVHEDLGTEPLRAEELGALAHRDGPAAQRAVEAEPVLAYGATLLLAVLVAPFALLLQLGDGDILVIPAWGAPTRPLPDDPRLLGNETTSLCLPHADREFRVACLPVPDDGPTAFLLASDGLGNAYPDDQSFLQVGADLLARILANGLDAVAQELETYLREASRHSGDDVTVAVIWTGSDRTDASRWRPVEWPRTTPGS
jgi:serine/threonine protein phosphatase PrpC